MRGTVIPKDGALLAEATISEVARDRAPFITGSEFNMQLP
jgi:hypothetical protein